MVKQKSGRGKRTIAARRTKPAVTIESAVIGTLVSREAKAITPLMSKVYLALLVAPPEYWDRRGVLHFTGEQHEGQWRTAWQQVLEVTGVASVTASKALQWMHREKLISYYSGRNGYGIHIVFHEST